MIDQVSEIKAKGGLVKFEVTPFRRSRSPANVPATLEWADRFFNELVPSRLFREMMPSLFREQGELIPAFDISETGDHFVVRADLPGIDAKNLDINLTGNVLTISGEKKEERTEEHENSYYSERRFGSFSRSFSLPADVKEERIEASYKDGVLQVNIPKSETARHKKIEVKTG